MSLGRKHLYISTLSFSVARTSSFLNCPLKGSANTISFTHRMAHLAQRGFICVILAVSRLEEIQKIWLKYIYTCNHITSRWDNCLLFTTSNFYQDSLGKHFRHMIRFTNYNFRSSEYISDLIRLATNFIRLWSYFNNTRYTRRDITLSCVSSSSSNILVIRQTYALSYKLKTFIKPKTPKSLLNIYRECIWHIFLIRYSSYFPVFSWNTHTRARNNF